MFLNGCSTRPQVQRLLDAGIAAVIATARPIDDRAACKLAVAFYEALTDGGRSRPGRWAEPPLPSTRPGAYVTAWSQADGQSRHLIPGDRPQVAQDLTNGDGMPWDLFVRPGAEQVEPPEPLRGRSPVRPARPAHRHRLARRAVSQPGVLSVRARPHLLRPRSGHSRIVQLAHTSDRTGRVPADLLLRPDRRGEDLGAGGGLAAAG